MKLLLSCEHGGNKIPANLQYIFKNDEAVLETHRGFDLGALDVFNHLKPLANTFFFSEESRLLIELNRSLHHKNLFSEFSKSLSKTEKDHLILNYKIYRNSVETEIRKSIENNETVLHLSVHSFTPILHSIKRNCDIGLLYDSKKKAEKEFCQQFKSEILAIDTSVNVRYNYPYLGKADGFTTYLRKQFPTNYIGVELEVNQQFSKNNKMEKSVKYLLYKSLENLI
ncbi:N-formylglutamate amidohydrolase [Polaribacter aestuariivivens]|uniref:N-formylglutamate amidohydrolase n=1 Tax=Polaribacter aestuariivivens TaxID=2304626 RepID=A0A5S3NA95_9FLAO|nr:N-formylglutamate amidohydrolase [Polaribacter aestuariivivens]TMM30519.1 N-formylglutamate amidohydrolase [Polaribacter aestuariivivens]